MLHRGKRIVKVMKQGAPFLILRRLAEANGVVFELSPMNQQNVFAGNLQAAPQLMRNIARPRCDNGRRFAKGCLEGSVHSLPDVQKSDFKNHIWRW